MGWCVGWDGEGGMERVVWWVDGMVTGREKGWWEGGWRGGRWDGDREGGGVVGG